MKAPNITQGKWRMEFNTAFDGHPRVMARPNSERLCVASTIGTKTTRNKISSAQKQANARAIAAVPDLLEAIELRINADKQHDNAMAAWDESDIRESQNRVASAVVSRVWAASKMRSALIAAGYTEE